MTSPIGCHLCDHEDQSSRLTAAPGDFGVRCRTSRIRRAADRRSLCLAHSRPGLSMRRSGAIRHQRLKARFHPASRMPWFPPPRHQGRRRDPGYPGSQFACLEPLSIESRNTRHERIPLALGRPSMSTRRAIRREGSRLTRANVAALDRQAARLTDSYLALGKPMAGRARGYPLPTLGRPSDPTF